MEFFFEGVNYFSIYSKVQLFCGTHVACGRTLLDRDPRQVSRDPVAQTFKITLELQ